MKIIKSNNSEKRQSLATEIFPIYPTFTKVEQYGRPMNMAKGITISQTSRRDPYFVPSFMGLSK